MKIDRTFLAGGWGPSRQMWAASSFTDPLTPKWAGLRLYANESDALANEMTHSPQTILDGTWTGDGTWTAVHSDPTSEEIWVTLDSGQVLVLWLGAPEEPDESEAVRVTPPQLVFEEVAS